LFNAKSTKVFKRAILHLKITYALASMTLGGCAAILIILALFALNKPAQPLQKLAESRIGWQGLAV
jgi:hypothetical protein